MLKYTLGALIAIAIVATTGLVVLAQVDDSDADVEQARHIDIIIPPGVLEKAPLEIERGAIVELQLANQRERRMVLSVEGEGIEQLPELPGHGEVGSRDPLPYIAMEAAPGSSDVVYARFNVEGEYEAKVYPAGDFYVERMTIIVK